MTARSKRLAALLEGGLTMPTRIMVNGAPDVRLASNDRSVLNHFERSRLVGAEWERVMWLLKESFGGTEVGRYNIPVTVAFKVRLPKGIHRDSMNLSEALKVWLDVLTLGTRTRDGIGLLWGDDARWVRSTSQELDMTGGEPYTEIRIVPV